MPIVLMAPKFDPQMPIVTIYIICLVRTEAPSENRHAGLSQIIVDLKNDGAKVRPISNMAGGEDFNEVVFEDVLVPKDRIVGEPGNGWQQVTS